MTQCTVYVYDDTLTSAVSQFIEIRADDHFGKALDLQTATTLSPSGFGANLTLPSPPEPIVFWVDDTSGSLAPTSLGHLNGKETARLDVILYTLPVPPGGGGGPTAASGQISSRYYEPETVGGAESLDAIASYINQKVELQNWNNSEGLAVRSLVDTAIHAINSPGIDSDLRDRLARWRLQLKELGIALSSQAAAKTRTTQGGSQMTASY